MEIVSLHIMLKLVTSLGLNNIHSFDILPSQGVEWEGSIVPHFAWERLAAVLFCPLFLFWKAFPTYYVSIIRLHVDSLLHRLSTSWLLEKESNKAI